MKIFVTGTRGIPDIPGGIEKHCQELFPRVAHKGHQVTVSNRDPYVCKKRRFWRGVEIVNCFAPRNRSLEAIVHTFVSLLHARKYGAEIVHIHAIGPSLLTPLGRLMGFKVVVTNHGPDYNRQKWGRTAKNVLRLGEKIGGLCANEIIAVSEPIRNIVRKRCHREAHLIYNGINLAQTSHSFDFLSVIGAKPRKYILAVARFVPEKGLHDLITAFKEMDLDCKLVLAGDADHKSEYSRNLRKSTKDDGRIIMTGYVTDEPLNQLYTHARLFVLPSYHEGLPIALLEAMNYGLAVLVSDIPANREVALPSQRYFRPGDLEDLKNKITALVKEDMSDEEKSQMRKYLASKYDWDHIADQTIQVYRNALKRPSTSCSSSSFT
jgi:glycosyltransferase involved in cell wall biosynthesis